jgi:hypothetical protein
MPVIGSAAGFLAGEVAERAYREARPSASWFELAAVRGVTHSAVGGLVGLMLSPATLGADVVNSQLSALLHAIDPEVADKVVTAVVEFLTGDAAASTLVPGAAGQLAPGSTNRGFM